MLSTNRVIWEDGSTLRDQSVKLNNFLSETAVIDFEYATDYLYLGSDVPFNHRYFAVEIPNIVASTLTVEIWNGSGWQAAVDVQDMTAATSGTPLGKSGIIKWVTDRNKSWQKYQTTESMTGSGLETLKIYNMYWVRLSFSANLTKGIFQCFGCGALQAEPLGQGPDLRMGSLYYGRRSQGRSHRLRCLRRRV